MDERRPATPRILALEVGDAVRLRRAHPCGGSVWRVTRIGADVGIACTTCGRRVMLERRELERRVVAVERSASGRPPEDPRP